MSNFKVVVPVSRTLQEELALENEFVIHLNPKEKSKGICSHISKTEVSWNFSNKSVELNLITQARTSYVMMSHEGSTNKPLKILWCDTLRPGRCRIILNLDQPYLSIGICIEDLPMFGWNMYNQVKHLDKELSF